MVWKSSKGSNQKVKDVTKATNNGERSEVVEPLQLPRFSSEDLVNQAVDKTFKKLVRFMEEKCLFGNNKKRLKVRGLRTNMQKCKKKKGDQGLDIEQASLSEATIYDTAVQPDQVEGGNPTVIYQPQVVNNN